jgi:hypothetical protein
MRKLKKRSLTLLEVLIAFLLIVVAVVPLLAPFPVIYKEQMQFIHELEMERLSSIFYVDFVGKILRKEIDPGSLAASEIVPIQDSLPIPYKAFYRLDGGDEMEVVFVPEKGTKETTFKWVLPL